MLAVTSSCSRRRRRGNGTDQGADALAAGAAGAAERCSSVAFSLGRSAWMTRLEIGQIDAAGGDVGRDADAGAAVAHGLQRMGALVLAEFAGKRHGGKAAFRAGGRADAARLRGCGRR